VAGLKDEKLIKFSPIRLDKFDRMIKSL